MESQPTVLVTGATGFLGSWVIKKALESNKYKVRGSMRNHKDEKRLKSLRDAFGDDFDRLELVSADLTDDDAISKAVEGCDYVLHVASPFPAVSPKDDMEVIRPAVAGNESILNACDKHNVKRVVITSSCSTIDDFSRGKIELNEEYFCEPKSYTTPYIKSKIAAEKRAWELIDEINDKPERKNNKLEMTMLLPSVIAGPLLLKEMGATATFFSEVLSGTSSGFVPYYARVIDVRDCAEGHLKALETEPFKRYAMISEHLWIGEAGKWVEEEFTQFGYKPVTKVNSAFVLWLGSWFNKDADYYYGAANVEMSINTDKTKEDLQIDYISLKKSYIDMCYSFINLGMVEAKGDVKDKMPDYLKA
jgi:nucleoside-diphosphate-sugar epimerase